MAITDQNLASENFWLNIAAESIYDTYNRRAKAVENLQKLIAWGMGLFTTGSFLIYFFPKADGLSQQTFQYFCIAIGMLVLGYFLASVSGFPLPSKYNANDPADIKIKFTRGVIISSVTFSFSILFVFAGFLFIALGIFQQGSTPRTTPAEPKKELQVAASLQTHADSTYLPVIISHTKAAYARIIIRAYKSGYQVSKTNLETVLENGLFPADSSGHIAVSRYVGNASLRFFSVTVNIPEAAQNGLTVQRVFTKKLQRQ